MSPPRTPPMANTHQEPDAIPLTTLASRTPSLPRSIRRVTPPPITDDLYSPPSRSPPPSFPSHTSQHYHNNSTDTVDIISNDHSTRAASPRPLQGALRVYVPEEEGRRISGVLAFQDPFQDTRGDGEYGDYGLEEKGFKRSNSEKVLSFPTTVTSTHLSHASFPLPPSSAHLPSAPALAQHQPPPPPPVAATISLLFSLTTKSTFFAIILPAIIFCVVAGLIPPYMTQLIGTAFEAFTAYGLIASSHPSPEVLKLARHNLMESTKKTSLEFLALALLIVITSTTSLSLWVVNGERTARALRKEVFESIGKKELEWFDLGMGAEGEEGEAGDGTGGLVGRFSKDTDDTRLACSQTLGHLLTFLVSFFACLGLSFYHSWLLTLVILSSVPVIAIVVSITEGMASPLGHNLRDISAKASSSIDRMIGSMPTVKAFNAATIEKESFRLITELQAKVYCKQHFIWGIRSGFTQFILMSMFVQGFWFGAYLVKTGKVSPGGVSTCFWACLLATNFLQMALPMLITLEKGKIAMAGLLALARSDGPPSPKNEDRPTSPTSPSSPKSPRLTFKRGRKRGQQPVSIHSISHPTPIDTPNALPSYYPEEIVLTAPTPTTPGFGPLPTITLNTTSALQNRKPNQLRKLQPSRFTGELSLSSVTFHYPSRPAPAPAALKDVSMYLAASETTFIVGSSGSGKSTVGSLLLGLYKPEQGSIEVDEQGLEWIDPSWLRGHVGLVSQGASVIFEGTVHDNIAIGVVGQWREDGTKRKMEDVTREEVMEACRGALIHEFVRDLPDGYDTWLSGEKGASLSGGQRQRLAIARAWLRDPTVLILDEATSALDATSRLLVSEALKTFRKNKTTVIITHDLTPIGPHDFVYVLTDGVVVDQGYRQDLERNVDGAFYAMAHANDGEIEPIEEEDEEEEEELELEEVPYEGPFSGYSLSNTASATGYSNTLFGTLAPPDISTSAAQWGSVRRASAQLNEQLSLALPFRRLSDQANNSPRNTMLSANRRPSDQSFPTSRRPSDSPRNTMEIRRSTLGPSAAGRRSTSVGRSSVGRRPSTYDLLFPFLPPEHQRERMDSNVSFSGLEAAGHLAASKRNARGGPRIKHKTMVLEGEDILGLKKGEHTVVNLSTLPPPRQMSFPRLLRFYYPSIPNKLLFFVGLFLSIVVGVCTPFFSVLLAKLMTHIGTPNNDSTVLQTSLLILLIAAIDGLGSFGKFYALERCAMYWIYELRMNTLEKILVQDKSWFDKPENSTTSLAQLVVKDTEDTRTLVGTIISSVIVIISMLGLGLTWAFVAGWELTLVGMGMAPVFVFATKYQAELQSKYEMRNKRMREQLAKEFHQITSNVRAIRSMSMESKFGEKFTADLERTYVGGRQAAPLAGLALALGGALTYISEALLFYVGAVLIVKGRYTFGQMVQVFSLIIFSVTFSGQIMGFLPAMTKSIRAAVDFCRLVELSTETKESEGRMTFPIDGRIVFDKVCFAYPERADIPILQELSFDIKAGECVGIVGASGSGKSTITSLLQRLYEPDTGSVLLDGRPLKRTDVRFLRDHIAIVSQHPALFDMTIAENIAYGCETVDEKAVIVASKAAHLHDFVMTLPKGYETMLGENASLISGGQAQRLQIARALVRPREILILDECTSALDPANQQAVMETVAEVKKGKTTLIVTHKLAVMETCDRLLVISDGVVAESGTVAELRAAGGIFAQLASGGEWESS